MCTSPWSLRRLARGPGGSSAAYQFDFEGYELSKMTNSSDLYFVNNWTKRLAAVNTNGSAVQYQLMWQFLVGNCTKPTAHDPPKYNYAEDVIITGTELFTIQPGAQQPDLPGPCPTYSFAYDILGTSPLQRDNGELLYTCNLISKSTASANPCGAKVDDTMASSISAALTASACAASPTVLGSRCPSPSSPPPPAETTEEKSLGSRVGSDLGTGMTGVLGLMGPLLAGVFVLVLR